MSVSVGEFVNFEDWLEEQVECGLVSEEEVMAVWSKGAQWFVEDNGLEE